MLKNKVLGMVPNLGKEYQGQDKCIYLSLTKEQYEAIRKIAESKGYGRNGRSGGSISAFIKTVVLSVLEIK